MHYQAICLWSAIGTCPFLVNCSLKACFLRFILPRDPEHTSSYQPEGHLDFFTCHFLARHYVMWKLPDLQFHTMNRPLAHSSPKINNLVQKIERKCPLSGLCHNSPAVELKNSDSSFWKSGLYCKFLLFQIFLCLLSSPINQF